MFGQGDYLNRGCEAIIRSTIGVLNKTFKEVEVTLATKNYETDSKYKVKNINKIIPHKKIKKYSFEWFVLIFVSRILNKKIEGYTWVDREVVNESQINDVAFSIGGDNYCYSKPYGLFGIDKGIKKSKRPLVFWGCSIEPTSIDDEMLKDLELFDLITTRESITYDFLIERGLTQNTKLYPDPAFTLEPQYVKIPFAIDRLNVVGINISPLIQEFDNSENITYKNYDYLINYIINKTDMTVLLIPHVYCPTTNDLESLTTLYNTYKDTGRVFIINDKCNCSQLKYMISKCKFFIAARTHASIAAYSSCIPTLVVGYSVKAKGIARDIFGTYENYVIPVQSLYNEDDLTKAFQWLCDYENDIRTHLQQFMPLYIEKAWQAGEEVKKLIESR